MRLLTFMNAIADKPKCKADVPTPTAFQMHVITDYENGYISLQEALVKLMATDLTEIEARTLLLT